MTKIIIASWDGDGRITAYCDAEYVVESDGLRIVLTDGTDNLARARVDGYENAFIAECPAQGGVDTWRLNDSGDGLDYVAHLPPVPRSVTPYQARRALTNAGLRAQIEAFVLTLDQDAQDAWQYGLSVERNNPVIAAAAMALSLTETDVDALFRAAVAL